MKLRHIISSALITITIILFTTLPVLAEQASAESADFTVNTVPEPSALILLVMAGFLFRRMRGAKTLCIALFALFAVSPFFSFVLCSRPSFVLKSFMASLLPLCLR